MFEIGANHNGHAASRQSVGFEVLKKFSSETKTFAALDFQGRLLRRDGFVGAPNDMEGMNRPGWTVEYHNAYADLYDLLGDVGSVNARIGRFYIPFGLNLQTDTHGTILQLSNERNFGFERDWYAGLWGTLSGTLRYDIYYLLGSGYPPRFGGKSGLVAGRLSLTNQYSSDYGLEGGLSFLGGQRISLDAVQRSPPIAARSGGTNRVDTLRAGLDVRYRKAVPTGLLTWTSEISAGRDAPDGILTQLHQLDYLHASRRWGFSSQFRWFRQDTAPKSTESALLAEATWYFANDVSASTLHWIKLNCEAQLARQQGARDVVWTLQYYRYW